ncbi:MAG: hypothetical protein ACR2HG_11150 [Pyrinomonadaceae bacterium]
MTNQQNIGNNLPTEITPSRRVFAFSDLPKDVQDKLLEMQNTDGDFLRVRYVYSYTSGALLYYLSIGFGLFFADFVVFLESSENAAFDLKWIIVFVGGASVFALCYLYLFRKFFRGRRSPVKKGIYLTPTQVIETFDGTVRYRELKDVSKISVDKFQGGWRTSLDVKFSDGDFYKYYLYMKNYNAPPATLLAEGEQWREKAELWRSETIIAAQRGDSAYFDSLDVIPKSAMANTPVLGKYFPPRLMMRLMFIISMAMVVFAIVVFYVIKASSK